MSSDTTVRAWIKEHVEPLLPPNWGWSDSMDFPQTINKPTVVLKHLVITPLSEAPRDHLRHEVTITIADPHEDHSKADIDIDDQVLELVMAIDFIDGLTWERANKVLVNNTYLGWDISCSTLTKKKGA